jgi:hypothetical protein
MNKDVSDSVGDPKAGAANRTEDVKTVQGLLDYLDVEDVVAIVSFGWMEASAARLWRQ